MINMHDGNCKPFSILRAVGRVRCAQIWELEDGALHRANHIPAVGWRLEGITWTEEEGIRNVGVFRPGTEYHARGWGFALGTNLIGPAACYQIYRETENAKRLGGVFLETPHASPHPQCSCGHRIVHDVRDIARYYYRHRDIHSEQLRQSSPPGTKATAGIFGVHGKGRIVAAREFGYYADPHGTVRAQVVGIEAIALLDSKDEDAARHLRRLGFVVHLVDKLEDAHEAERCSELYTAESDTVDPAQHTLELAEDPGKDGAPYATASGELGLYGAAGVLLRTEEHPPRYLLQRRSDATFEPGTWSPPGGAAHSRETPGQTAARELAEETGITDFSLITPERVTRLRSLNWKFETIIARVPTRLPATPGVETQELGWFTALEMNQMKRRGELHPLFAKTLAHVIHGRTK